MPVALDVQVFFDFVCPWCAIGKRQLETALQSLVRERPGIHSTVAWHGLPLNPEIPRAGLSTRSFHRARMGGDAAAAARQAHARESAREIGMEIDFDRIGVMPNTLAAHRLTQHIARTHGDPSAFIDALFDAHFVRGEHIGTPSVLARVAARCGFDDRNLAWALAGSAQADALLLQSRERWRRKGVHGVPHFVFNGRSVAGIQSTGALAEALRQAVARIA
jgi:predicted DsbA family dithiol-disulfide isomerase